MSDIVNKGKKQPRQLREHVPTSVFTPEYRVFVELFREVRVVPHLSQQEIAAALNKPQSYISKCESGERRIDIIELYNYCEAVGIPFSEFTKRLERAIKRSRKKAAE